MRADRASDSMGPANISIAPLKYYICIYVHHKLLSLQTNPLTWHCMLRDTTRLTDTRFLFGGLCPAILINQDFENIHSFTCTLFSQQCVAFNLLLSLSLSLSLSLRFYLIIYSLSRIRTRKKKWEKNLNYSNYVWLILVLKSIIWFWCDIKVRITFW
jgi:hypothetical protein